jgi:hypothetical protein
MDRRDVLSDSVFTHANTSEELTGGVLALVLAATSIIYSSATSLRVSFKRVHYQKRVTVPLSLT